MSDNYQDLDPSELDQLADELDALVLELAGRARYLRTLSLRHRVAGRTAKAERSIGVAEKMIEDGFTDGAGKGTFTGYVLSLSPSLSPGGRDLL